MKAPLLNHLQKLIFAVATAYRNDSILICLRQDPYSKELETKDWCAFDARSVLRLEVEMGLRTLLYHV